MTCPHYVSFSAPCNSAPSFCHPRLLQWPNRYTVFIRKGWAWGSEEKAAFRRLKELLSTAGVLAHFAPSLPLGVACDASVVGIGATLFHRFSHISKTLTASQRNYSQTQRSVGHQFRLKNSSNIYMEEFILVTDHQPLVAMFGPNKPTPALAANRLSRWVLFLRQFNYTIEYCKTSEHSNAYVLSRLPV